MSLVFSLLKDKDWERTKALINVNRNVLNEIDNNGCCPVFYALENPELVELCLKECSNCVRSKNNQGMVPLHMALVSSISIKINNNI